MPHTVNRLTGWFACPQTQDSGQAAEGGALPKVNRNALRISGSAQTERCRAPKRILAGYRRSDQYSTIWRMIATVLTAIALVASLGFNYLQYTWRKEEREQHKRERAEA